MTKHLALPWEYVFTTCLPERLDHLAESFGTALKSFRLNMSKRVELRKASSFALATRQVESLEKSLKDMTDCKATLTAAQKEASRLIVPTIAAAMAEAYSDSVGESGESIEPLSPPHTPPNP